MDISWHDSPEPKRCSVNTDFPALLIEHVSHLTIYGDSPVCLSLLRWEVALSSAADATNRIDQDMSRCAFMLVNLGANGPAKDTDIAVNKFNCWNRKERDMQYLIVEDGKKERTSLSAPRLQAGEKYSLWLSAFCILLQFPWKEEVRHTTWKFEML